MTSMIFLHITMSAFVIGETTSATLHYSKLMFESSAANSLNMKSYLQTVSQKRQTVLHFIETVFEHRSVVRYSLPGSGHNTSYNALHTL